MDRFLREGDVRKARALLNQLLVDYPEAEEVWLRWGKVLAQQKDSSAPKRPCCACRLAPESAQAHFTLGLVLLQRKAHRDAAASFRRATELLPDFAPAYYQLSRCRQEEGDSPGAIAELRTAIRRVPQFTPAYSRLASLLARSGRREEALVHVRSALQLDAEDPEARKLLQQLSASIHRDSPLIVVKTGNGLANSRRPPVGRRNSPGGPRSGADHSAGCWLSFVKLPVLVPFQIVPGLTVAPGPFDRHAP